MNDLTPPIRRAGNGLAGASAVLSAAALWGTIGPAQVLASPAADPGALGVARLLLGGAALALFCLDADAWRGLLRRSGIGWVLIATLATGIYQITFMHAVAHLGAAHPSLTCVMPGTGPSVVVRLYHRYPLPDLPPRALLSAIPW